MEIATESKDRPDWKVLAALLVVCIGVIGCENVPSGGVGPGEGDSSGHAVAGPWREGVADAYYADGSKWEQSVPLSPGRILPRDMDDRQWSAFVTQSGIQADRTVKTFTPTWLDFSTDPTGTINYHDFGKLVVMWVDTALSGVSDDVFMRWSAGSIPEVIRPTAQRVVQCYVDDNVSTLQGAIIIDTDGSAVFAITQVSGVQLADVSNNFSSPAVSKGLPSSFLVMYQK